MSLPIKILEFDHFLGNIPKKFIIFLASIETNNINNNNNNHNIGLFLDWCRSECPQRKKLMI
ncbi:MAG: hypothetical protein DRO88_08080 [Promethearchaeia archaeon]|nr:MAG: hypothetical protein DRO88_08080 [Candidatus Lokiarchaeia archaeon]